MELCMQEMIQMTQKAQKRSKILELVVAGYLTLSEASQKMDISYRQSIRLMQRYKKEGDTELNHRLIGRPSNNKKDESFKQLCLNLYQTKYYDFGPTFASEKLQEEHSLGVDAETLRLWLIKAGLWSQKRERAKHRRKRPRKKCFGEMLQIDGSIHHWFEDDRQDCLMEFVDDATGTTMALFDHGETTIITMKVLYKWIEKYGIPLSIYSDYKSVFYTDREPTLEEQLAGIEPVTEFGRVCQLLGIEMIFAKSAQAKGRVERKHAVQQDRLVKEMRLKGIKDTDSANEYLEKEYLDKHNQKFAIKPQSEENAHVQLLPEQNLKRIICFSDIRSVGRNYIARFENHYFQLTHGTAETVSPGNKVEVQTWLDDTIHILFKNIELSFYEVDANGNRAVA